MVTTAAMGFKAPAPFEGSPPMLDDHRRYVFLRLRLNRFRQEDQMASA